MGAPHNLIDAAAGVLSGETRGTGQSGLLPDADRKPRLPLPAWICRLLAALSVYIARLVLVRMT